MTSRRPILHFGLIKIVTLAGLVWVGVGNSRIASMRVELAKRHSEQKKALDQRRRELRQEESDHPERAETADLLRKKLEMEREEGSIQLDWERGELAIDGEQAEVNFQAILALFGVYAVTTALFFLSSFRRVPDPSSVVGTGAIPQSG